jgi:periplasmic copper chaperone A
MNAAIGRTGWRVATVAALVAALGTAAMAGQKPVTASKGWVLAPAAGASTAQAFVVVENPTMYDVYVVSASSDVSDEVQLREASPTAAPQLVKEATAPAYSSLEMKPDGVHLSLNNLKRPLKIGETVTITLTTDSNAVLQVSATVKER